jgi:LPXTG-motif cell wall-anchored protein
VTPYDLAAGQLGFTVTVSSSQGASASTQRQITIGRSAVTLPETGSDVGALITLAAFATSVGVLLVGAAKRRQSRSLIVAGSGR